MLLDTMYPLRAANFGSKLWLSLGRCLTGQSACLGILQKRLCDGKVSWVLPTLYNNFPKAWGAVRKRMPHNSANRGCKVINTALVRQCCGATLNSPVPCQPPFHKNSWCTTQPQQSMSNTGSINPIQSFMLLPCPFNGHCMKLLTSPNHLVCMQRGVNASRGHQQRKNKGVHQKKLLSR